MKFGLLMLPNIPTTMEERRRERPIAARTGRWQRMLRHGKGSGLDGLLPK